MPKKIKYIHIFLKIGGILKQRGQNCGYSCFLADPPPPSWTLLLNKAYVT